ncbi:MAG TPA: nuclear transport factor 2 family protein [Candidatus Sulfotelmatobacter sp.]
MQKMPFLLALLLAAMLASPLPLAHAQSMDASDHLFQTIQALDTEFFDAYNHCDLAKMSSMVAEDLEFYHDKTGLALGRQNLLDAIKNNLCGKVTRELVPGTLEVYPIAHYGAVEIGVHRFHHPGQADNVGEAKFIHLWQNKDWPSKDGKWQITRVISFDHQPLKK